MNSIETVFEWLLAATMRASVLAVVILGIQVILRRWLPAGWRHALWLPMLAVLVLPVLPKTPFGLFPRTAAQPAPVAANLMVTEDFVAPAPVTLYSEMRTTEHSEHTEVQRVGWLIPLTLGVRGPILIICSFSVCSVCSVVCHLPL